MKIKELKDQWMRTIKDSEIQRNLIWSPDFKVQLLESIIDKKPIGAITLFKESGNSHYEIIDGKQRIYSIEAFFKGDLSFDGKYINNLTQQEEFDFWDYELAIQYAEGTFEDKVKLFNKINKNVVPLKPFELLRAQYYGDFVLGLTDFVNNDKNVKAVLKTNIRGENELLVLNIINNESNIDKFLQVNQKNDFNKFIKLPRQIFLFITDIFKSYVNLKILIELAKEYQIYKSELMNNRDQLNKDIKDLLSSNHVEGWNKLSAYERILDRYIIEKDNKRLFNQDIKQELWSVGIAKNSVYPVMSTKVNCSLCLQEIDNISKAETDHIVPWSKGGKTVIENAQLVHKYCNIKKGNKK